MLTGQADIRLALTGIVLGQGFLDQGRAGAGQFPDGLGQLDHAEFAGIAQVDGAGEVVRAPHEADEALDEIVHIAEGAGLATVAVEGDGLVAQGLDDEVGDDAAVVGVHARAVGVEDAGDLDAQAVLAAVVAKEGLGAALAFVVAGAGADGVDVAPVVLWLGVDGGVAIDLAGGGLKDLGLDPFGQAQHVDGAVDAGLGGLDRVVLIMDGRGRAGQVVDLVHLHVEGEGDVVAHQLEVGVVEQVGDVVLGAGEEVIDADDVMAVGEEAFAEVTAQEAGAAGDEDAFAQGVVHGEYRWRWGWGDLGGASMT